MVMPYLFRTTSSFYTCICLLSLEEMIGLGIRLKIIFIKEGAASAFVPFILPLIYAPFEHYYPLIFLIFLPLNG